MISRDILLSLWHKILKIRMVEEKIIELYPQKEMRCPVHLSIGQEAVAAGVCGALKNNDIIFSTHRCHSHTVAKGANFKTLFAELYGKETGCAKGKGGSMHFVAPEVGAYGASAIVGGNLPLAVGAAFAAKKQNKNNVVVAFFGDGSLEQGTFHESLNFASLHKLPIIFVCENNEIATCTHISARQPHKELHQRAAGYRIPGVRVDGTKVTEVFFSTQRAVRRAQSGHGPTFIEATCYRWKEHVGPNTDYHLGHRTKEELDAWMQKDPIKLFEQILETHNLLPDVERKSIVRSVEQDIETAIQFAKQSPFPKLEAIFTDI